MKVDKRKLTLTVLVALLAAWLVITVGLFFGIKLLG
jgi:hypothetical protein